jgi:CheY-like chemotaxis protein
MNPKKKILIVEDDDGSRKLMSIVLGRSGYEILEAADGAAAIEATWANQPVDLIIMDLELPGLTGSEVIRRLKKNPSTSRIPVLVTTSFDRGTPLVLQAIEAGADKILYKPTPMNILIEAVRQYLS